MLSFPEYTEIRDLLLDRVQSVGTQRVPLLDCFGRVLAADLVAEADIPAFDRSPYDGYAFRASDTAQATRDKPITLRILEEIAAGDVPTMPITPGTAAKILTGAPIPEGADAVINYEATRFTAETVTLFDPVKPGSNIVRRGDDVRSGTLLARRGDPIDAGIAGTLAAQGIAEPEVFRKPRIGIMSTGSELVEADEAPGAGMIRNSNAYTIAAALRKEGIEPVYFGIAADTAESIAQRMEEALGLCDGLITTGGVSVGDYDLTPDAMERCGVEMLCRGVLLKPGMACAYGIRDGKPVFGLSGNPASCVINLYTVALPALRKLTGRSDALPREIPLRLDAAFPKKSGVTRILRGTLVLDTGEAVLHLPASQGNVVLSSTIGCDAMAVIPGGSGPQSAGTILKGFLI